MKITSDFIENPAFDVLSSINRSFDPIDCIAPLFRRYYCALPKANSQTSRDFAPSRKRDVGDAKKCGPRLEKRQGRQGYLPASSFDPFLLRSLRKRPQTVVARDPRNWSLWQMEQKQRSSHTHSGQTAIRPKG